MATDADQPDQQELKLITVPEGKICDYIDNAFRNDTPEEYVRQNIEKRLVNELKFPKDRIKVGDAKKRVDLAIFEKDTAHTQENIRVIDLGIDLGTVFPSATNYGQVILGNSVI